MRSLFFILLFFQSHFLQASELNFTYSYTYIEKAFNLELYELSKVFEERNFQRLTASPMGNIPLVHADEVMTSPYHKGSIFIKMDLIAPKDLQYKIIAGPDFYLFHTKNASISFFDFDKNEVAELVKGLTPSLFSKIRVQDLFISSAHADEVFCNPPVTLPQGDKLTYVGLISGKLSSELLMKKLGECGVNALKAMNDKVDSTKDFFMKLKDNPMKLWQDMRESFVKLKQFIKNLSSELESFYQTISGMTLEDQYEIGCKMMGEAVPGLVLTATGVGVGVGIAKIMGTLIPKMQKLKSLLGGRHYLTAKEALSCAF